MTDRTAGNRVWMTPLMLLAAGGLAYFTIDHATGDHFSTHPVDGALRDFFDAAEQFGTPFGQLLLLVVLGCIPVLGGVPVGERVTALSAAERSTWDPRVLRIFVTSIIAGLSANVGKLIIARTRPRAFDFSQSLSDTFGAVMPLGGGGSAQQSFPSAHSACAFGFAVAMSWAWPRQRPVFFFLAMLACLQRVVVGAHFPSDVCTGAALGYVVATLYIHNAWVTRCWDAIDQRLFGHPTIQVDDSVR